MKLTYVIAVEGFGEVSHPKDFHRRWLQGGPEGLFEQARALINGERPTSQYSSQPAHGRGPDRMPGWEHIGCLGRWHSGNPRYADCHCLEVLRDPDGRYFLVDQMEHGDYAGHDYDTQVLEEVTIQH